MTEKVVDFPDHINDAAALLEDYRQKRGDGFVAALEAVVIGNMLRRHHDGPVGGILKLMYCAESLFGPLGLSVSPTGEGPPGFPILIELPEKIDRILIGGQVFVKSAA